MAAVGIHVECAKNNVVLSGTLITLLATPPAIEASLINPKEFKVELSVWYLKERQGPVHETGDSTKTRLGGRRLVVYVEVTHCTTLSRFRQIVVRMGGRRGDKGWS